MHAGPRKRRRQEVEEEPEEHSEDSDASRGDLEAEEPEFDSRSEDSDESQAEEATPEPKAELQQKRPKPRRTSARQTPKVDLLNVWTQAGAGKESLLHVEATQLLELIAMYTFGDHSDSIYHMPTVSM